MKFNLNIKPFFRCQPKPFGLPFGLKWLNLATTFISLLLSHTLVAAQESEQQNAPPVQPPRIGKGILELSASDTTLSIGGRVRLNVIFNSASVGGMGGANAGDVFLFPSTIPLDDSGEQGELTFSARDSRLWFKTRTPTDYGNLKTLLEVDFWGSSGNERFSNSHSVRLRHAYAEFAGFTMGQTFSTFINVGAYPETNTTLPPYMVFARQPLIRWTKPFKDGDFQMALEQPETTLTDTTGQLIAPDDDRLPDIAGKVSWYPDWGLLSLSALLRQIRSDSTVVAGISDAAVGGGIHIAGRIKTVRRDNVRFGLAYGNALGRYVAANGFNDGSIDNHGQISLHTLYVGHLAYQHWWNQTWRSSIGYSHTQSNNDLSIVPANTNKQLNAGYLNLLWSPVKNASFGIEYIHAEREWEDGQVGELERFQFTASYNF